MRSRHSNAAHIMLDLVLSTWPGRQPSALLALVAIALAATTAGAEQAVELKFDASMNQWYGEVFLGGDDTAHRVVFDTGSADIWLPGKHHQAQEGESFSVTYESGDIKTAAIDDEFGLTADTQTKIRLGECVGEHIAGMSMEAGIVGLGFPCLAHYTQPTLLEFMDVTNFTFNIRATDSSIVLDSTVPADTWEYAPLVTVAPGWELAGLPLSHISFWLVQIVSVAVKFEAKPDYDATVISFPSENQKGMKKWPLQKSSAFGAHAIVDSGSNLLVVPKSIYRDLLEKMCRDVDCIVPDTEIANPYCNDCSQQDFPAIEFRVRTSGSVHEEIVLVLEPEFYVNCRSDGGICSCDIKLTKQPSDTWGETWIFGANVMSSFQPLFDVAKSRVGFACTEKKNVAEYCKDRWVMPNCPAPAESFALSLSAVMEHTREGPRHSHVVATACLAAAAGLLFLVAVLASVVIGGSKGRRFSPPMPQAADPLAPAGNLGLL